MSCDVADEDGEKWADFAFNLLANALRDWGIGGKTNAGYGRLIREGEDNKVTKSPIEAELGATLSAKDQNTKRLNRLTVPAAKKLKYKKGDTVEVTRIADPNEKRDKPYFKADDGICGMVVQGSAPSVDMGKKTKLVINGVMEKEGLYNFGTCLAG